MSAASPLLVVRNLNISLQRRNGGARPLFRNVSFTVSRGEVVAIIGQSGSGKTTLARAVVGLLPAHVAEVAGEVVLAGKRIDTLSHRERRKVWQQDVSLIFQDPAAALNPTMTISRQVFPPKTRSTRGIDSGAQRAEGRGLLQELQLADPDSCLSAYPFELSGGMKQRILIASSLLSAPSLIVADEPTSALDPILRNHVLELFLGRARKTGLGVLLITHDLPLVSRYSDRTFVLDEGTLAESENPVLAWPKRPDFREPVSGGAAAGHRATESLAPVLSLSGLCVDVPVRGGWLRKPARSRRILDYINLEIRRGEIVGLLGSSGAGKSTLGRCVLGLVEPSAGTVEIGNGSRRDAGRKVQIVYQNPFSSLSPKMTVRSIVLEPLRASRSSLGTCEREERFAAIMADVGMGAEFACRLPHELSGGQRQRVAIARALISKPDLVVADEPVSSLDAFTCDHVLELICRLRRQYGFACLFISHDLGVLSSIADRIAVMDQGRIVEIDTPERLLQSPSHPCTASFVAASMPRGQVAAGPGLGPGTKPASGPSLF